MDTQSKKRGRLPAFFKRVNIRISTKLNKDLGSPDDSPPDQATKVVNEHTHDEKKASRRGRFRQKLRQWTVKQTNLDSESQPVSQAPHPPRLSSSQESTLVDQISPQTSQEETCLEEVQHEETTLKNDVETSGSSVQQEVTPSHEIPNSTRSHEEATQEAIQPEAAAKIVNICEPIPENPIHQQSTSQEICPPEDSGITETFVTHPAALTTCYSSLIWSEITPQAKVAKDDVVVFKRDKSHARKFANSVLGDKRAFWADASYRRFGQPGEAFTNHGGIAVAKQVDSKRWTVYSAHVTGLSNINDLEKLAVLLALQKAVEGREDELTRSQNGTDERPVFRILSDNADALTWLEKAISLGTAVRKASQKLEATDNDDNLSGLLTLSEELENYTNIRCSDYTRPEKTFATSIGRRILEEYYKLRRFGIVEFHWVPGHKGLRGNEIADRAASNACQWYAKVAPRLGTDVGLVMPLEVRECQGYWISGPQPTNSMASQTLESAKHLWTTLTIESSEKTMKAHTPPQVKTMISLDGMRPENHQTTQSDPWAKGDVVSGVSFVVSTTAANDNFDRQTISEAMYTATARGIAKRSNHQDPQPHVSLGGPQSAPSTTVAVKKQSDNETGPRGRNKRKKPKPRPNMVARCRHCGRVDHVTQVCFEKFPEQKQASPKAYKNWTGRHRLEKVTPGAFMLMRRLHPQLKGVSCQGSVTRYMLGRAGLSHDLATLPAYRSVRFPMKREGADLSDQMALQHRRYLLAKYEWPQ